MVQWSLVVMSVLVVIVASLAVFVFLYQKWNINANLNNTLYPFSATIQPGKQSSYLKNAAGTAQIDCSSVGGKINIVGAWTEVVDPYGQCTGKTADVLNLTCGLKGQKVACNQDNDCGPGMTCAGGLCSPSKCVLTDESGKFDSSKCSCGGSYCTIRPGAKCSNQKDCNDPTGALMYCDTNTNTCQVNPGQTCMAPDQYEGKVCASYPICSNVNTKNDKNVENKVCSPSSTCRPRDASAYLAAKCDGKETCPILFNPSDPHSGFGPMACNNPVGQLPITPGQGGSFNQGYYVHGIYTCIVPQ